MQIIKLSRAIHAVFAGLVWFMLSLPTRLSRIFLPPLKCRRGESSVGQAVAILIAIVIGALLLAGLYLLFSSTVLPTLTQKIREMFNYSA
jgi:hypothetical protein